MQEKLEQESEESQEREIIDKKSFIKMYFGLSSSYKDDSQRGYTPPHQFLPFELENNFKEKAEKELLRILKNESIGQIKDFSIPSSSIDNWARRGVISSDEAEEIKNKLREARRFAVDQPIKAYKEERRTDTAKTADELYSLLADPSIWQRRRVIAAMHNILRDVIEKNKGEYYISDGEALEFNQSNFDFNRIEIICYDLIEKGEIKEANHILEAMKEKIQDPLVKGIIFRYSTDKADKEESRKIFDQHREENKKRIIEWFSLKE